MMFQRSFLFALTLASMANGLQHDDELFKNGLIVNEEFLSFEDIMAGEGARNSLRGRELQNRPTCSASSPGSIYVCGEPGMPSSSCQSSSADCNGLSYGCTCSDTGVTTCSYCRVQTSNAVICQVVGSSMTFAIPDVGMTSCSCDYLGNGQMSQNCFQPSPRPVPLPTFVPAPWDSVRVPAVPGPAVPVPVPAVPVPVPAVPVPVPAVPVPVPVPSFPVPVPVPAVPVPIPAVRVPGNPVPQQEMSSSSTKQKKSKK